VALNDPSVSANSFTFIAKLDVLNHCGDEARHWLERFSLEENYTLATEVFEAMVLFRRHQRAQALAKLDGVDLRLGERSHEPRSIVDLLRRWHLAAMAYYHYLEDDLDAAEAALEGARQKICDALTLHPFLVPAATHCIDFRIQRARIARRRNQWREVQRHLDTVRAIYSDRHPFCELASGRKIYLSDLRRFYLALPLTDKQLADVQFAVDENFPHHDWIDRLEENIFALPDWVIPYP
jgi:hypothetical protein